MKSRIFLLLSILFFSNCNTENKNVKIHVDGYCHMALWYDTFFPMKQVNRPFKVEQNIEWMKKHALIKKRIDEFADCHYFNSEINKVLNSKVVLTKCQDLNILIELYSFEKDTLILGFGDNREIININGKCYQNELKLLSSVFEVLVNTSAHLNYSKDEIIRKKDQTIENFYILEEKFNFLNRSNKIDVSEISEYIKNEENKMIIDNTILYLYQEAREIKNKDNFKKLMIIEFFDKFENYISQTKKKKHPLYLNKIEKLIQEWKLEK